MSDLSTPVAVLGGAALIAGAVYFGLRQSGAPPPPQALTATATAAAAASPASVPLPQVEVPKALERNAVETSIRAALEAQKPLFRERCWNAAVKASPAPAKSTYVFDVSVDEQGRENARGISEAENARADVGQCLRLIIAPITVAPTHRRMTARVPIELP